MKELFCKKCGAFSIVLHPNWLKQLKKIEGFRKEKCGCYSWLDRKYGLQTYNIIFSKKIHELSIPRHRNNRI